MLDGWHCEDLPAIPGGCVTRLGLACSRSKFRGLCLTCRPAVMFTDEWWFRHHDHIALIRCPHCAQWLAPATLARWPRDHATTTGNRRIA